MKLTGKGIKERSLWEKAGILLPGYEVEAVSERARKEPEWVHIGIGNIFRVFITIFGFFFVWPVLFYMERAVEAKKWVLG